MTDKITLKDNPDEFSELCGQFDIEYLSTIHHFEKNVRGIYAPVFWEDIKSTSKPKER